MTANKATRLLISRKFWVLIFSLLGIAIAVSTGHLDVQTAAGLAVGAGAAYQGATAIEDHGVAVASAAPPQVTVNAPGSAAALPAPPSDSAVKAALATALVAAAAGLATTPVPEPPKALPLAPPFAVAPAEVG